MATTKDKTPDQPPSPAAAAQAAEPGNVPAATPPPAAVTAVVQPDTGADARRIAELEAKIALLQSQVQPAAVDEGTLGGNVRPDSGPRHKDGHLLFNPNRPTGRHG